jgi:peptidoglycan/LPS O-acetylase OafA/YrhL
MPALDGLRAVSLLIILAYHGGAATIPGGFLSVDIFFVLSGFLITSLLLAEWERHGSLDLRQFWLRRARRLLPAMLLVVAVVLVASIVIVGHRADVIRSDAIASLGYVSNWWFVAEGTSYFDQFNDPSPLRHMWSLSIEEQWYLLLPLVLVVVLPRLRSRRALGWLLVCLGAVSAIWMAARAPEAGGNSARVYYGTDTRVQALLIGSALAALLTPGLLERVRPRAVAVGWGGAAVALVALVLLTEESGWTYRGGFLVFAVATAAVVAAVVSHPSGWLANALGWGPLVLVGQMSYGLYLWHWPIFLFLSPARTGLSGWPLFGLRLVVTFAVAGISYRYLEQPIRRGGLAAMTPNRRWLVLAGTPLALAALVGISFAASRPAAPDSLEALAKLAPGKPAAAVVAGTPTAPAATAPAATAPVTAPAAATAPIATAGPDDGYRAVLVGDSNSLSLFAGFKAEDVPRLSLAPAAEFGCGVVPFDAAVEGRRMPAAEKCGDWVAGNRHAQIAAAQADIGVLFAGSWEQYDRWLDGGPVAYTDPRWRAATTAAYAELLRELHGMVDHVALVLDSCHQVPELDLPVEVLFEAGRYPAVVNDPARIAAVNQAARSAAAGVGFHVEVIDPGEVLCADGYQDSLAGVQLRTDGLHFSSEGSRVVWRWLGPRLVAGASAER